MKDGSTYLVRLPSPPESGVSPSHLCDVTWYGLPTSYSNAALPVRISSPLLVHLAIRGLCPLLTLLSVTGGFLSIVPVAFQYLRSQSRYLRGRFVYPRAYEHIRSPSTSLPQQHICLVARRRDDFSSYLHSCEGAFPPISVIRLPTVY